MANWALSFYRNARRTEKPNNARQSIQLHLLPVILLLQCCESRMGAHHMYPLLEITNYLQLDQCKRHYTTMTHGLIPRMLRY